MAPTMEASEHRPLFNRFSVLGFQQRIREDDTKSLSRRDLGQVVSDVKGGISKIGDLILGGNSRDGNNGLPVNGNGNNQGQDQGQDNSGDNSDNNNNNTNNNNNNDTGSGNGNGQGQNNGGQSGQKGPSPPPPPPPTAVPSSMAPPKASPPSPPPPSPTDGNPQNIETQSPSPSATPHTTLTAGVVSYTGDLHSSAMGHTAAASSRSILSLTAAIPTPVAAVTSDSQGQGYSSISTQAPVTAVTTSSQSLSHDAPRLSGTPSTNTVGPSSPPGMNPAALKAAIAAGSILGCFILLAVAWFAWRSSHRKSARQQRVRPGDSSSSRGPFRGARRAVRKMLSAVPSMKRSASNRRGWTNIDDSNRDSSLSHEKHIAAAAAAGVRWYESDQTGPNEHVTVNPYGMIFRTPMYGDSMSDILAPASPHAAKDSISSTRVAHPTSFIMTDTGPNASKMQQHPMAQRHAGRPSSYLSSLSSGFGDGDIIIPAAVVAKKGFSSNNVGAGDNSDISRRPSRSDCSVEDDRSSRRRDTIYTEVSEDTPLRFRNINSWVHQQTGRVKRAAERNRYVSGDDDEKHSSIPPVPLLPPEQVFDMMLSDGELPRRVEDTSQSPKSADISTVGGDKG